MAIRTYKDGAGASTGHRLVTASQLDHDGDTWYLDSVNGVDAVSPAGKDRKKPLATLAQAHTNAAVGDIIIALENHAETLTATQAFGKDDITLVGEGTGTTRPRFTAATAGVMFNVTGLGNKFFNLYFPASTTTATSRFDIGGTRAWIEDCQFDNGAMDTASVNILSGGDFLTIRGTTFSSTSGSTLTQPGAAVQTTNVVSGVVIDTCTFDGGIGGWALGFAVDVASFGGITGLTILDVTLLCSDITLGTSMRVIVTTILATGSSKVV